MPQQVEADLVVSNVSEVVTCAGAAPRTGGDLEDLSVVQDGYVACRSGRIVSVGSRTRLEEAVNLVPSGEHVDAGGGTILPGFVDPHTHLVFAGSREDEFDRRLRGETYIDIGNAGGGIMSTVRSTRAASREDLVESGRERLDRMLLSGVTTCEIKSGYGLTTRDEVKQLQAVRELNEEHPVDLVPTFLGAHWIPEEFKGKTERFVDLVVEEMIPEVGRLNLARYCDVFCEDGVFDVEQSRRILTAAREFGMEPRMHADELAPVGGAELAAELRAKSADHIVHISDGGIEAMAEAGVVAVLLPGTSFFLMGPYAPARKMIAAGLPVALSTDFNPGSSNTESMPMMLALACLNMKMTVAEAISAATVNAAYSIDLYEEVGSLEVGKKADFLVFKTPNYYHLVYHWGVNLIERVYKEGRMVVQNGRVV